KKGRPFITSIPEGHSVENLLYNTSNLQLYNEEGVPVAGIYQNVQNDFKFSQTLKRVDAKELALASNSSNNPDLITSLYNIIPDEHYLVDSSIRRENSGQVLKMWRSIDLYCWQNQSTI
ncbi:12919_t:CDS:1, partial [Rhizophagus irregularis]